MSLNIELIIMIMFTIAFAVMILDTTCLLLCVLHVIDHPHSTGYEKQYLVWKLKADESGDVELTGFFHPFMELKLTKRIDR